MRRDVGPDGEHPDVIVADMCHRPRPAGQIIVVANEKGGVGKSTLAFHLAVALADAGHTVAAIDLDVRQRTLSSAFLNRDATARRLGVALPLPRHHVLRVQSGAMLCQEIGRLGWDSDFFIIDAPGHDSGAVRRAIAFADHVITPVNGSFVDLDLLARLDPVTHRMTEPGCFATMVNAIRMARARHGMADLNWMVLQNRVRRGNSHNQTHIDEALRALAAPIGFSLIAGWPERVAYRELFLLGLTYMDMKRIPAFARSKVAVSPELKQLVAALVNASRSGLSGEAGDAADDADDAADQEHFAFALGNVAA